MRETVNIKSYETFLKEGNVHWDEFHREYFLLGSEDPETGAPTKGVILGKDPNTVGRDFSWEEFQDADLEGVDFSDCNLSNCDFSGAYMRNVTLKNADITRANFSNANMENVIGLETCKGLNTANLDGANLEGVSSFTKKRLKTKNLFGI